MTTMGVAACFGCVLVWALVTSPEASAESPSCDQISAIAKVARAKSLDGATEIERRAGGSFRAQVVFASRRFQLKPSVQSAERLLSVMPADEAQVTEVMTIGDSICDGETVADMFILGRVGERLPSLLARAVLAAPRFMPAYVKYGLRAVQDPHNDYAVQMRRVCQKEHHRFALAVAALALDEQRRFTEHVMSVAGCEILAAPEVGQ